MRLKDLGNPLISFEISKYIFRWENSCFLNGLKGDLIYSYSSNEINPILDQLVMYTAGDNESQKVFEYTKKHLYDLLGGPLQIEEDDNDRCITWSIGNVQVILYLFEMHAYRLSLTIKLVSEE